MILLGIFVFILIVCLAFLQTEGMWSNILTTINITISGLVAMNYFEPLAKLLDENADWLTYWFDFIAVWLIFATCLGVLQRVSRMLSSVKVKFPKQIEQIGAFVSQLLVGYVLGSFMLATLHMGPFPWDMFGWAPEMVNNKPNPTVMGSSPDLDWLCFTNRVSKGLLSRKSDGTYAFDPDSSFLIRYAARRKAIQESGYLTVAAKK